MFKVTGRIFLLAACACFSTQSLASTAQSLAGFDAYMKQAMAKWRVPGAAVAILKDGRVIHMKGYGFADIEERRPVDPSTLFSIGSASKAFTAAAAASLVQEGKLSWDTKVRDLIPEFTVADAVVTEQATLRDLLGHRTGLERADAAWAADWCLTPPELLTRIKALPPHQPFRTKFLYNNLMYGVAGEMVARAAGTSWADVVRARILKPLGMSRTAATVAEVKKRPNVATPYVDEGGAFLKVPWHPLSAVEPAGAINSSAADMVNWMKAHMDGGRFNGKQVLSEQGVREMQLSQIVSPDQVSFDIAAPGANFFAYGLGWRLHDYRGEKVVDHTGGIGGFSAEVTLIPAKGIGIVTLTNAGNSWFPSMAKFWILDSLLGDGGGDEAEWVAAEAQRRGPPIRVSTAPKARQDGVIDPGISGIYESPLHGVLEVDAAQGSVRRGRCAVGELKLFRGSSYIVNWANRNSGEKLLTFQAGPDGKFHEVWGGSENFTRYKRSGDLEARKQ